jgi:hypothetical protein
MRCARAHRMISGQIDGDLGAAALRRLERHLAVCADCRRVREDVIALAREARGLETPPPSDRVWAGIRAGLAAGRREVPDAAPRLRPQAWLPGFSPALRYATIGLLALLLVAGGAFLGQRVLKSPGPAVLAKGGMNFTMAKLAEAEDHYRQAVKALQEAVAAQSANYSPQVKDLVGKELAGIDALIKTGEDAVRRDPSDLRARAALLDAFRDKVEFLEAAVDIGRVASPQSKADAKI